MAHSPETRAKIAESQRRAWLRPEYRAAKTAILQASARSPERRAALAESMRLKRQDPVFIAKLAEGRRNRVEYKSTPAAERVMARTVKTDSCWLYPTTDTLGYGMVRVQGGKGKRAHRVIYEALVGPIPEGLELDHLCGVRNCVNPEHLEPVTHAENMRRATERRG